MSPPLPLPRTAPPDEVLRACAAALERGVRVCLATVLARRGSAPSTPGQKLLLGADGLAVGTVGGGAVERVVLERMREALDETAAGPRVETFRLGPTLGMCCGGSVEILIEPLAPGDEVLVVGAGHIGTRLAPLLATLGFRVTLSDPREEAADLGRLPPGSPVTVTLGEHDEAGRALGPRAAVLVMTHDHVLDTEVLEWALRRGFAYVGGVGSRAKAQRARARLEARGIDAAALARVRMPIGVDVGARSPAEIAVAIAAELIAWRAGRTVAEAVGGRTRLVGGDHPGARGAAGGDVEGDVVAPSRAPPSDKDAAPVAAAEARAR